MYLGLSINEINVIVPHIVVYTGLQSVAKQSLPAVWTIEMICRQIDSVTERFFSFKTWRYGAPHHLPKLHRSWQYSDNAHLGVIKPTAKTTDARREQNQHRRAGQPAFVGFVYIKNFGVGVRAVNAGNQ